MNKLIIFLVITVLSCAFALIPEAAMYGLWQMVHPETELARIVLVGIFWFGGVAVSIAFGFIGFAIWASAINTFC